MLDIELIRRRPDQVRAALASRGEESALEPILALDARRRDAIHQGDELRARRNQVSQEIGRSRERSPELIAEMRQVGDRIKALEDEVKGVEEELSKALLTLPNLPRADVPIGLDASANIVRRTWGQPRAYDFQPKAHWDLNDALGIIDFQRGARMSGARFVVLRGQGARLQRALITWMLDVHTQEHGYIEIYPPALVKSETLVGSSNLPKFADNLYHDAEDDLWLVPTAEVNLTAMHAGEILEPGSLPIKYAAYTPCFRKEKTAAGRDTRGIKRVHQFDKVEMYAFVEPERSDEELQKIVADAEDLLQRLGLHYRVLQLCTGDMGFPSARSYDLEVWSPGCQEWLEVSSCSNCTDFQARRAGIRFRREARSRPELVHTLNGSGLALPRIMIAILETFQQSGGSVVIPDCLRPYTGFEAIKPVEQ
ncbi:MAG: serine--tRNA ligase [Chloroflexi bacterium]|nr:serine--tRNA ligase [Chloroflexota bacterium]